MILYNEQDTLGLARYGMDIPIRESKAARTFSELIEHPVLGPLHEAWHRRTAAGGIEKDDLLRVHSREYVQKLYSDQLRFEVLRTYELVNEDGTYNRYDPAAAEEPLEAVVQQALQKASGTWQCCRMALDSGFCFYFGGGMHHAHRTRGKGFCLINDVVIAPRKLQAEGLIQRAWIIDVDAHKGDGTAALTYGDDSIVSMSLHMAEGWPLDEPEYDGSGQLNPSYVPSDIDVPIPRGGEADYLARLDEGLARLDRHPRPDLALVLSGADPYAGDELASAGQLQLSLDQLLQRDRRIYTFLEERGIPKAYLMAGGYGTDSWRVYSQFLKWVLARLYT
jgi:acetoin utilization deacetylase AcuC-like enzyme